MMTFKKKLLTVFWISQNQLTVVQGLNTKLDFCVSGPIDWSNGEKARADLLALIPLSARRQIGELCLVLPRSMFFTKLIHLPTSDEQEIRQMVSLQISQLLPYAPEQAVWDFVVSGQRSSSCDVLVLAVQSSAVMKYLHILSLAGFFPDVVTVSSFALAGLLKTVNPAGHAALLLPDDKSLEICFCADGNFYFSRSIAYGAKDFTADKLTDFWAQLRLTFESQRKNFSQYGAASGLYLFRSSENLPEGFLEQLAKSSGIGWEDLSTQAFKKKIELFYAPHQQNFSVDEVVASTMIQYGIKNVSNFLPKNFKERHSLLAGRRNKLIFILLFLGSFASLSLATGAVVFKKMQQLKVVNEKLERLEAPFFKLRKQKKIIADLQQNMQDRISPLALIEELYHDAPLGVAFSKVRVLDQNKLDLEGQAFQSAAINDLQEKMIASSLFRDVHLEHTLRRTSMSGEVVSFEISAKLQRASHAKED